MSQKLSRIQDEIDQCYKTLLNAQIDGEWERADSIQTYIGLLEEREREMVKNTQNVRNNEGAV